MAGTPYLVDSNILLRWVKPDHNDYPVVVSVIDAILRRNDVLCYTSQNVGEFWNTCTRPLDRNGYDRIIVVVWLDPPEEDVAIDEVRRPCHLAGPHRSFRGRSFQSANSAAFPIPLPCLPACDEIRRRSVHREARNSQSKPV